jgi:hypothetical protein
MPPLSEAELSDSRSANHLQSAINSLQSHMPMEFVANGSARAVARAIEQYAHAQGRLSAIVVPWEGTVTTVSMSVTSVKTDGWAIEHTNLGTITLTDRGNGTTAVAMARDDSDRSEKDRLAALFDNFARQLQHQFQAVS